MAAMSGYTEPEDFLVCPECGSENVRISTYPNDPGARYRIKCRDCRTSAWG